MALTLLPDRDTVRSNRSKGEWPATFRRRLLARALGTVPLLPCHYYRARKTGCRLERAEDDETGNHFGRLVVR